MYHSITLSLLFLFTCTIHAAEVALPKDFTVKAVEVELVHAAKNARAQYELHVMPTHPLTKLDELDQRIQKETVQFFGKQKANELYIHALGVREERHQMTFMPSSIFVPLSIIGDKNDSDTIVTCDGSYELTVAPCRNGGNSTQDVITHLRRNHALRIIKALEYMDLSFKYELTKEQFDAMSQGDPKMGTAIVEMLHEAKEMEKRRKELCVIQ